MTTPLASHEHALSHNARIIILTAAFLGWACSGLQMAVMNLAARPATMEYIQNGLVTPDRAFDPANLIKFSSTEKIQLSESQVKVIGKVRNPQWFSWYNCSFLIGAAFGGLVFGGIGDRFGRVKAMGVSILCYSLFAGLGFYTVAPEQLLVLRFLSAMGVGGMWPNGVALASEAWSDASRPMLSGLIGASANFGIVAVGIVGYYWTVTPDSWRWLLLVVASPFLLGVWVLMFVPESPQWLAVRAKGQLESLTSQKKSSMGVAEVFRPPLLKLTLIGIGLGAIPLLGGWGVTGWFIPWTDSVFGLSDQSAKALTSIQRAGGGALGSLLGGYLANLFGRRTVYFFISLISLAMAEYIFFFQTPHNFSFGIWVFALGFVSTV
ncbi:MAG: MFS transporter, partial [Planctomycetaceae bacterium]